MLGKHWEFLRNHESFELVKRDYLERHGRTPSTQHAREISASFSHARSYFKSAMDSDLTVKPLLLYYGVVSLSRGLTLSLSPGRREATLAPSHGLSVVSWNDILSKPNPDFSQLKILINGSGSFHELGEATCHFSHLRHNSSDISFVSRNTSDKLGKAIALGDVMARIPALQEPNIRWRGVSLCVPFETDMKKSNTNGVVLKISGYKKPYVTKEFCESLIAGTKFKFQGGEAPYLIFSGPNEISDFPGFTDHVSPDTQGIGKLWLVAKYENEIVLSKIETLFAISYIFGMLVRYFPTQWTALIRGQIEDSALPAISSAVEFLESDFPGLVCDFLSRDGTDMARKIGAKDQQDVQGA